MQGVVVMNPIITSYIPFKGYNIYVSNVRRLLSNSGYASYPVRKVLLNPRVFFKCKIFNFNWFEEVHSRSEYVKKAAFLILLKMFNKKIVFTLHNKHPHETTNQWSIKMTNKMCLKSDAIIGLCPDTDKVLQDVYPDALKKLTIIPHPNYIANYSIEDSSDYKKKYGINDGDLVFLYLGVVSPYKNIDLLLDVFVKVKNPHVWLIIAGNPSNPTYGENIKERVNFLSNVIVDFRHIPEDEIPKYYRTSTVVILPYQKDSYLNSGAVYLSFSLKRTVICPLIGSINMIKDKSFVYSYDYEDESNHGTQLEKIINKVLDDYKYDRLIPRIMGQKAFEYIKIAHSDELVSELYKEVYDSLL